MEQARPRSDNQDFISSICFLYYTSTYVRETKAESREVKTFFLPFLELVSIFEAKIKAPVDKGFIINFLGKGSLYLNPTSKKSKHLKESRAIVAAHLHFLAQTSEVHF